jgi:uncharacterized protein YdcH (DUF465 family)
MEKSMRMAILKERHQHLDDIIDEMNERRYLSPGERDELSILKVRRLKLKDNIRDLESNSRGVSMMPPKFELK